MVMEYDSNFWIKIGPLLFLACIGVVIVWATWPEEKARMKKRRELREQREKNGVTGLAIVTMSILMDGDSDTESSSSSSDDDSSYSGSDFD